MFLSTPIIIQVFTVSPLEDVILMIRTPSLCEARSFPTGSSCPRKYDNTANAGGAAGGGDVDNWALDECSTWGLLEEHRTSLR